MKNTNIKDKRHVFDEEVQKGHMGGLVIDYYNYCDKNSKPKADFYKYYEPNEEEIKKTEQFRKRFIQFVIDTRGEESVKYLPGFLEGKIKYRDDFGYITVINPDRDMIDIYFYGRDEDTAFTHAITSYMFRCGDYYEYNNRKELAEDFRRRFPDDVREDNYYGPFYFIEYALSKLNTYFKGNIPEQIRKFYEGRLGDKWQFDYEQNHIVKRPRNLEPQLLPPEDK